jgi:microcystin-dependent protein
MAGTLPLAMAQQMDANGQPLAGALVYFFVAGTVATPQNNYADFGLTVAQANPLTCDNTGRVPMFWLADGLVHVRMTDSTGSVIIDTTMQTLGPSSGGGGGGGTVDPTALIQTGNIIAAYRTGPLTGYVRANALTIGNASSGASEYANAAAQNLFVFLYGQDPNIVVSGGRTGNALNDFNANKTLQLPDLRGRAIMGLADMGNSATAVLNATYFSNVVTTLGAAGGSQSAALSTLNVAGHTHNVTGSGSGVTGVELQAHTHNVFIPSSNTTTGGGGFACAGPASTLQTAGENQNHTHNVSVTITGATDAGTGGGTPFPCVTPAMLMTCYIKL